MKKTLVFLFFISTVSLFSCESEKEKRDREIEEKIYSTLTRQAKSILNYPNTYEFQKMNKYRVNDSIKVYAQKFSGTNGFGVKETKYAIGYFNTNTGNEIDRESVKGYANPSELKSVATIVNAR